MFETVTSLIKKNFFLQDERGKKNTSILAIIISFIILLPLIISRLAYPYDLGRYESHTWEPSLLSINGYNPYSYALQSPFLVSAYGYFYYLIIGSGIKVFGLQFWFGRIITIFAAVICIICVGKIVFFITNKKSLMYLSSLSVIVSIIFQSWIANQRADFPSLAFAYIAITIAMYDTSKEKSSLKHIATVILCLICALFCKQTILLPCVIVFVRYAQTGKIKHAFMIFFGVVTLGLIVAISLNFTSNGGYYFQHFQITRNIPYSYYQSLEILKSFFTPSPNYVIFPILIIGIYLLFKKCFGVVDLLNLNKKGVSILSISVLSEIIKTPTFLFIAYWILAFIWAFYTSARNGASDNYYLEFILISAILFGTAFDNIRLFSERKYAYIIITFLMVSLFTVQTIRSYRGEYFRWQSLAYYQEIVETINNFTPKDGIFISPYPDLIALTGRKYEFGDIAQYVDGRSPELQKIVNDSLQSDRYSAIILQVPDATTYLSPNCKYTPMKHTPPVKFYPVYLYICNSSK